MKTWLKENADSTVKKVVFNVFGDKDLEIFKMVLEDKANHYKLI